jgi:hypothetical protein
MPKHPAFASNLAKHMQRCGFSHSDLATAVWGRTTDIRGYSVAKNRDRIGSYLAGVSMPTPENLSKIAVALGCTIEDLAGPNGMPVSVSRRTTGTIGGLRLNQVGASGMARLQIDEVLPWEHALEIANIVAKHRQRPESDAGNGQTSPSNAP